MGDYKPPFTITNEILAYVSNAVYYYKITEEKGDRRCGLVI